MKFDRISISTRFAFIIGGIFTIFYILFTFVVFFYMKERAINDAKEKAKIVIDIMDGIGEYANLTLKPIVMAMIPELQNNPHLFISEVLSTTRIRNIIMEKSGVDVVRFSFKRLSNNPRNPLNLLEPIYGKIYEYFLKNRDKKQWEGIINIYKQKNLVIARSVLVSHDCLKCHGEPYKAPKGIILKYGEEGGFGYKENDIMGIEIVSIPLDVVMTEIKEILINIIVFGMVFLLLLFLTIEGTFLKLIGIPLYRIANHFKKISKEKYSKDPLLSEKGDDEISQLISSFNTMIKDLNEAYNNLLVSNITLETVINGISDPLALINNDCSIIVLNNAYQDWISNKNPFVLIPENSSNNLIKKNVVCEKFKEVFETKKTIINEYKTESNNYYLIHYYPIIDNDGNVNKIVHYIQDLTHIKNIENQIIQSEKLAAIGKLAAGIAHEINNPLGIIKCYNDILLKEIDENSPIKEDLKIIDKHVNSCKNIIERLLCFSRNNDDKKELKDLNDIINEVILLVNKQFSKENIKIKFIKGEIPQVYIKSEKMKQVFLNILMNSKDAMKNGGDIVISTKYLKDTRKVEIIFSDTGSGISEDDIKKIFEPFFTTKKPGEGTGLGLFIAYNIIKEHNGDIGVNSIIDKGTDIIMKLPIDQ